ncbi:MAG: sterol desaturase family protein [Cyclobacteriaceae bacterium]
MGLFFSLTFHLSLGIIYSLNTTPVLISIPLFAILVLVELGIHFYQDGGLYRLNDAITNISCGLIQQAANLVLKVCAVGLYQWLYENVALFDIPINAWSIAALFILADFCYYWSHRKSHEVHLLWGSHVVHHQSEDFNLSVALRQGILQTVANFWCYLPLAILGFDTFTFLAVSALINLYQFWLHTEVVGNLGWLEYVFNTPSHHRVHHGRNPEYIDKNYGGVLILWDRMFGTFAPEQSSVVYGSTQPIDSWNPLWVNLSPYLELVRQLKKTSGWANRWRILWRPPGWKLSNDSNNPVAEKPPLIRAKYDAKPHSSLYSYLLFQFLVVGGSLAFFLLNDPEVTYWEKCLWVGAAVLSLVNINAMFERVNQATTIEFFRLAGIGAIAIWCYPVPEVIALALGYYLLSLLSLWVARTRDKTKMMPCNHMFHKK